MIYFIIFLFYLILIFSFFIGWKKLENKTNDQIYKQSTSVVIAIRNEERNIKNLINSLKNQNYEDEKWEVIIVDDHSNDNSFKLLINEQKRWSKLTIIKQKTDLFGKKAAIKTGVKRATGQIILCTDADCLFNPNWIRTMSNYFQNDKIHLVSGPVQYKKDKGIFNKFQDLEFISLVGSGAGAIGISKPIFCNGANLAYRKKTFLNINPFNENAVSGDDVFLLHKIKKRFSSAIIFAIDKNAIVTTYSKYNIKDFLNQRKRWASKTSAYKDIISILTSLCVLITNIALLILLILALFNFIYFKFFLIFLVFKFLVDLVFLYPIITFFKKKYLLIWVLPFELIYMFYVVFVPLLSLTKFTWKQRKFNR